ncbi:5-dehydro-4-deoxy-D-glucuronate isomerase [Paenibacillus melissococcoides]|uniref:4-deoxy-L-threo-5-hexosulose-uronate ketol-isomerase n=1 Tax=Paenibacillus melissococcoides TaxID=2912268 RepID=A0ABN8U682_9BACL|nr:MULTISPECIES: 5-dehydro-4-deoxy-D-glucuronate isomerase [Paenibacillus]MEB9892412.1 5-dehydro-4-deoxy-D-glucuronate isomerase [Bacillus cereus]CAH8245405.1 5-dehydro-4-deoxy-D-glucuronate isomerase [Paenibacillus melissococcoides]CAH8710846.1 5-dehydro-4-deoxy-D-glucuronate isomerase [Paenibacillus melissococcoides]CAH8711649.1 5-dehydro-4-deoxy-D-glucuronate isomerase [Paenibacillus melissococcoides]GIO77695.1 4-deoxy-L-threo-5-hexosulose-uronate ketol-isomerase [Paenibacillus dendritiform
MEIRYACHPESAKSYDTSRLREEFLIEKLFIDNEIQMVYSHVDRYITGGVLPMTKTVKLEADAKEMGAEYFLERREIGIINVGGEGVVTVDGVAYEMEPRDCLYIGMGSKDVTFASKEAARPARFYFNSTPAHKTYPTEKVAISKAAPQHLGSLSSSNERTIYKYIHKGGVQSCQLVMGMTLLKPNNMWNTMPCHTHNRRSEVYFYFDMPEDGVVFHLMGEPQETRHVVVRNEQAIISPSWSIHSGVGTSNYTFIWGMAGENQTFEDMDMVDMKDLK